MRSASDRGWRGKAAPREMRSENCGQRGWSDRNGARRWAGRNSEPGVRVLKGWAWMAASRSSLYFRRMSRLWWAAASDQANWNSDGCVGVGGCPRRAVRASGSFKCGRTGKADVSGNGKVGRGTGSVDIPGGGGSGVRGVGVGGVS